MERTAVKSSQVASVGYDSATKVLEVEFHGGAVYQYDGVPADVADQFVKSESVGKFFGTHIRGHYEYRKAAA